MTKLHCLLQFVPRDQPGRLGTADALLTHTERYSCWWPTDTRGDHFAPLFRNIDAWLADWRNLSSEVGRAAAAMGDEIEAELGVENIRSQPEFMVFPDLETSTIGREPYHSHPADAGMMTYLLDALERHLRDRWGVPVYAGRYMPMPMVGASAGRTGLVHEDRTREYGAPAMGHMLRPDRAIWVHNYQSRSRAESARTTIEAYTEANVRWHLSQIVAAGAMPDRVMIVDWQLDPGDEDHAASFRAIKRVIGEREWPVGRIDVGVAGGWKQLQHWLDAPVTQVSNPPLRLSIDTPAALRAMADIWQRTVVRPFVEVFGEVA